MSKLLTSASLVIIMASAAIGQIVNNSSTAETSEDSITVAVMALDSIGNPSTADSFFIAIYSGGNSNSAVFQDSGDADMVGLDTIMIGGTTQYYYSRKIADIDGAGASGVYSGIITARSNAFNLSTVTPISFQITSWEFDDIGDSIGLGMMYAKAANDTLADGFASRTPISVDGGAVDSNRTEQGGSGDSTQLARWVWNAPSANHTNPGTFGTYLDALVSGLSGGDGAYSVTVVTYDSSAGKVAPGVSVTILNESQSAVLGVSFSDVTGVCEFNLNAGDYVINATAPGYSFESYDTVTIEGTGIDTVFGFNLSPGMPSAPFATRVYGYVYDISGQPDSGAIVNAYLPEGAAQTSLLIVSPFTVSAETDSAGLFFFDLIPNSELIPDSLQYEFTVYHSDGAILRRRFTVPDSVTWRVKW